MKQYLEEVRLLGIQPIRRHRQRMLHQLAEPRLIVALDKVGQVAPITHLQQQRGHEN